MRAVGLQALLQQIQDAEQRRLLTALNDAQLLTRFYTKADPLAFEELLSRHGPMVLAICKRILRNSHDAEDAFQATFLVFLRKAPHIQNGIQLANWLCAVAYRVARQAGRKSHKIQRREQLWDVGLEASSGNCTMPDWSMDFDAAVQKLPEKYRLPVILCELQGRSRAEVAEQMGLNENTVSSRLARGKDLLRQKLRSWDGSFGMALFGPVVLSPALLARTVPLILMKDVSRSVISQLAQGVMMSMLFHKWKNMCLIGISALAITSLVGWQFANPNGSDPSPKQKEELKATNPNPDSKSAKAVQQKPVPADPDDAKAKQAKTDLELLQGSWDVINPVGKGVPKRLEVHGNVVRFIYPNGPINLQLKLDEGMRFIDLIGKENEDHSLYGSYHVRDSILELCFDAGNQDTIYRPTTFEKKENQLYFMLRRSQTKPGEEKSETNKKPKTKKQKNPEMLIGGLMGGNPGSTTAPLTGGLVGGTGSVLPSLVPSINTDTGPATGALIGNATGSSVAPAVGSEADKDPVKADRDRIQGLWTVQDIQGWEEKDLRMIEVRFTKEYLLFGQDAGFYCRYQLSRGGEVNNIDFHLTGFPDERQDKRPLIVRGIYKFEGDALVLCVNLGKDQTVTDYRPVSFTADKQQQRALITLRPATEKAKPEIKQLQRENDTLREELRDLRKQVEELKRAKP